MKLETSTRVEKYFREFYCTDGTDEVEDPQQRRKGAKTQPNCAKRLDCAELASAFEPSSAWDSASPSSVAALRRVDCGGCTSRSHLSSMSRCNTPNLTSNCCNHSMLHDQPRDCTGAPPGCHRQDTVGAGGTYNRQRRLEAAEMQQLQQLTRSAERTETAPAPQPRSDGS